MPSKNKIKTVLIDDENHCNETLDFFIRNHLPELEIVNIFTNSKQALEFLKVNEIDLLFLDVQMPILNGFDLLNELGPFTFEVIFVTAFDHFAIKAIKYAALDYLQKPVDIDELKASVGDLESRLKVKEKHLLYNHLLQIVKSKYSELDRISLPTSKGYIFINLNEIVWIKADGNYSNIKLINKEELVVTQTLKKLEENISNKNFIRTHNSFLINKDKVLQLVKSDGGYLVMTDEERIPLSRYRKDAVIKELMEE